MKPIRVLLTDDHARFRASLRAFLSSSDIFQIVAEASDGQQALKLIETHQPDVVLMDIAMPGINGLEVTARITEAFPDVRVIILSMHANEEYVIEARRVGAAGYLLKDAMLTELKPAIQAVANGQTYWSGSVSERVLAKLERQLADGLSGVGRFFLSFRIPYLLFPSYRSFPVRRYGCSPNCGSTASRSSLQAPNSNLRNL